jgi:hypothetical protein
MEGLGRTRACTALIGQVVRKELQQPLQATFRKGCFARKKEPSSSTELPQCERPSRELHSRLRPSQTRFQQIPVAFQEWARPRDCAVDCSGRFRPCLPSPLRVDQAGASVADTRCASGSANCQSVFGLSGQRQRVESIDALASSRPAAHLPGRRLSQFVQALSASAPQKGGGWNVRPNVGVQPTPKAVGCNNGLASTLTDR